MDDFIADDLYQAIKKSDLTKLESLLKGGLNPNQVFTAENYPDTLGQTLLQVTMRETNTDVVKLLIKYGCDVNYGVKKVITSNVTTYELDKNVDDLKQTCLFNAIYTRNVKMVRILTEAGANINLKCAQKMMCALSHAVSSPVDSISKMEKLEIINSIICAKGCDINSQNQYGLSPLHFAAIGEKSEIVDVLLQKKAKVNLEQCQGGTPLFFAIDYETIRLLLGYGANTNHRGLNMTGHVVTPIYMLLKHAEDEHAIKALIDGGAQVTKIALEHRCAPCLQDNQELLKFLKECNCTPRSLKLQTALKIRDVLREVVGGVGLDVKCRIDLLPLPAVLKAYLQMSHI